MTTTKARKLTATTPHGTFTRKTARVYTHVVVVQGVRLDWRQKNWRDSVASTKKQIASYAESQRRGDAGLQVEANPRPQAREWDIRIAEEFYREGNFKEWKAEREKTLAKLLAAGCPTEATRHPTLVGWCGRPDLAAKLASKENSGGYYYGAEIFPVDPEAV